MSMNVRPPACSPATATAAAEALEAAAAEASDEGSEEGSLIALLFSLVEVGGVRRSVGDVAEADLLDHRRLILTLPARCRALVRKDALIAIARLAPGGWRGRRHGRRQR